MNFNESLIEEVKCREEIWASKVKGHKNSEMVRRLWEEVASELEVDVETCRTRWKTLRDRFHKERKKKPTTGSGASTSAKWPLMQPLEFLLPTVTPRPWMLHRKAQRKPANMSRHRGYPDDDDGYVTHSLPLPVLGQKRQFGKEIGSSSPSSSTSTLNLMRQFEKEIGSSSPASSTSTSDQVSHRKRGRTNCDTSSYPLEVAILERLSAAASTSQQLTANEHFFLAFSRYADGLSLSAQIAFQEGVMNAYKAAVTLDAKNKSCSCQQIS